MVFLRRFRNWGLHFLLFSLDSLPGDREPGGMGHTMGNARDGRGIGTGLFWGWYVVLGAFLILAINYGARYSFGVFVKPMAAQYNWSRSVISAGMSIMVLAYGIGGIFAGRLADRIGIEISGLCSFLFWPYPLSSNDVAKRNRGLELAAKMIQAAHDVGGQTRLVLQFFYFDQQFFHSVRPVIDYIGIQQDFELFRRSDKSVLQQ